MLGQQFFRNWCNYVEVDVCTAHMYVKCMFIMLDIVE